MGEKVVTVSPSAFVIDFTMRGVINFPPFAIVAVLAGQLRMNLWLFLVVGFVGRTLRFAAFLGGGDVLGGLTTDWF